MSDNQNTRKQKIRRFGQNRPAILSIIMVLLTVLVIGRLYVLQIVRGDEYLAEFQSSIRREIAVPAERGRIFDRSGKLLAYNETAYNIVIRDETTQEDDTDALLNETIRNTILTVEKNGDTMTGDFGITLNLGGSYRFVDEGILQQRFLADVYGHAYIEDLSSEERTRTAEGVIEDLAERYEIDTSHAYYTGGYSGKLHLLDTVICRYLISLNYFQKYIPAVIASDVSPETVEEIRRMSDSLSGVSVEETLKRVYTQGETMSNVLGYTGEISAAELEEKSAEGEDYRSGDIIGKLGIEASMEEELHGTSGRRTINVDSLGRELGLISETRSTSGSDVYLTIDSELQAAAYRILETSLANIILDRIRDRVEDFVIDEEMSASKIIIPISDVYAACFNNILDLDEFETEDATETEKQVYQVFQLYLDGVIMGLQNEIEFARTPYGDLSNEYKSYENYLVTYLYNNGVLIRDNIDKTDSVYVGWTEDESASLSEFLAHAVSAGWIDPSYLNAQSSSDSDVYKALCDYILENARTSSGLAKKIYRYMIVNEALDSRMVCQLLLDQGIVSLPDAELESFKNGRESAYTFMVNRIKNMQLTPAMLALDPCTASCVLTDPRNGQVLALVSYPGYDNNLLSNGVDQDYFKKISQDASNPMLDYATQQITAPGSTFKIVSSTAGLEEGVLTLRDRFSCGRGFTKIGKGVGNEEDPSPVCWVYPSSHGSLALSSAITHSCNMYFYEVGYRLGQKDDSGSFSTDNSYNSARGIERLQKYAAMYGLNRRSGVEIEEAAPHVATGDCVRAAIGQADNAYSTAGLARYVSTIANRGTCYDLTLVDKIIDPQGTERFNSAEITGGVALSEDYWNAIYEGMRGVVRDLNYFYRLSFQVAGKTGTAENASNRPNHSLFICFAPYDNPEIAGATRIAYGYTSTYAAQVTQMILSYYTGDSSLDSILQNAELYGNINVD